MIEKNFLTKTLNDTVLTRRSFLKWSAALGGTAALAGGVAVVTLAYDRAADRELPGELLVAIELLGRPRQHLTDPIGHSRDKRRFRELRQRRVPVPAHGRGPARPRRRGVRRTSCR